MRKLVLCLSTLLLSMLSLNSQNARIFGDSLSGFDENSAKIEALSKELVGEEFKSFLEWKKREFILTKYNLWQRYYRQATKNDVPQYQWYGSSAKSMTCCPPGATCDNADFEMSPAGAVTSFNGITGWTLQAGFNSTQNNNNSCQPSNFTASQPTAQIIQGPIVDPITGQQVVSQFGNGGPVPSGSKFLRLNDQAASYSLNKISKSFNVTPQNAIFKVAIWALTNGPHACCEQAGFLLRILNVCGGNTVISCPQFSVVAPSSLCNYTVAGITFTQVTGNTSWWSSGWVHKSVDLTPYIGGCVTIELIVFDCLWGAHSAYAYLDCECGPMDIIGNGNNFPAGTPSITLPTCGANGATITAPPGLGPYQWWGPGLPGSLSNPSFTHQTIITNATGQVTLQMNPAGACTPIVKVINVTITPAPNLQLTTQQPGCTSSLSSISGTLTVGPTPMTATVSGPSGTVPVNVTGNNLTVNTTTSGAGIYTLTIVDNIGCSITQTAQINPQPAPVQFSVGAPSNDYTLTCLNTPITVTASTNSSDPHTYTWTSAGGTLTGQSANITQPGVWTVVGQNAVSGCSTTATFTINQNLTAPTVAVTPTLVTVNCSTASPATFTGVSNLGPNVTTQWYFVNSGTLVPVGVPQGTINIYNPGSPGTYVFTSTNNLTGCSSAFTVQANTSIGVPAFTVTSITNFTVGCPPTNSTSIQVSTVVTSPTVGVGVQYALLPPGSTASPVYTNNPTFNNLTIPGTYTVWVKDITNQCESSQQVSIIQNTIAPTINHIMSPAVMNLTCNQPTVVLTGVSSNTNAQITWTVPTASGSSVWPQPAYTVNTNSAVSNATSQITSAGIFTVGALDPNNNCRSTKTVQVLQDIRLPVLTPTVSPGKLTCKDPDIVLSNAQASHTMNAALVTTYCWIPPSITNSNCATQLNTSIPGVHTCVATSAINGCSVVRTYTVIQDITPPAVANIGQSFTLDCGNNPTTQICVVLTTTISGLTYTWDVLPNTTTLSSLTTSCITVGNLGEYACTITNTVNGCKTQANYEVIPGNLNVDFTPDKQEGFAPLTVNFTNNSSSSTGSQSITSNWYFGNGSTATNTNNATMNTTYNSPGIYTVVLIATKGTCIDTAIKIIKVEIPSQMEVPNIFSPNKDGVNDFFRLVASNLAEVSVVIYDRWGNKVYETESATGNFAWDGKNLQGKDCAPGVYFYIINAKGKDDKPYEKKGNVTLVR
jgi:gliding motility-associated-like protein